MLRASLLAALIPLLVLCTHTSSQCPSGGGSAPTGSGAGSGPGASGYADSGSGGASTSAGSSKAKGAQARAAAGTSGGGPSAAVPTSTSSGTRGISGRVAASTGGGLSKPSSCSLIGRELDSWNSWWARNQDAFLWDVEPVRSAASLTASGRGLTGRGTSHRASSASARPTRSVIYTSIVPSLMALVDQADDPQVVNAAVRALGSTVEAPFESVVSETLIPLLRHESDEVRQAATLSLGLLGNTESSTLLDLATCSSAGHRLVAETEVPAFMRAAATLALGFADDPASVASLIDMVERLPDSEAATKRSAIHAMGIMRNPKASMAVDYLMSKIHDERMEPSIRSAIPTALGKQNRQGAVDALLSVLKDRDTDRRVQQSTIIGLGELAAADRLDAVETLIKLCEDSKDNASRHFAVMSLATLGARDEQPSRNTELHDTLAKFLAKAVSKPRRSQDRPWAALAAGVYMRGQPAAKRKLAERLMDAYDDVKDPQTRGAYALGLGLAGVGSAGERLLKDFGRTGDEELRGYLALALGFMGHIEAAPMLEQSVTRKGGGSAFRRSTGLACRLLGQSATHGRISKRYENESSLEGRLGLSQALGVLQHSDSVQSLARAAADTSLDSQSRASACAALGRVAEKSKAPWHAALRMSTNYLVDAGIALDDILGVR